MSLQAWKDATAIAAYGMTKDQAVSSGICIKCKAPPAPFTTPGAEREYQISGICEPCWFELFREDVRGRS